jgi:hypothetical protein
LPPSRASCSAGRSERAGRGDSASDFSPFYWRKSWSRPVPWLCGLAQAASGIGKIAGPLCLALIAGATNLITPKATIEAVTPAFLFLAACGLAIGLAFTLLGVETHGKPLALEKGEAPAAVPEAAALAMREQAGAAS